MASNEQEIQRRIAEDRDRIAETAGAIGYKADVPSRARDAVAERAGAMKEKILGGARQAGDNSPDADDAKRAARKAAGVAKENPLGSAIGALAFGFLVGTLLPATRVEDEHIGPAADEAKRQAREVAHEALERGQESAKEIGHAAADAAKEHAQSHGQELAAGAKSRAEDVKAQAGGAET